MKEDTVDHVTVIVRKLIPQPPERIGLLWAESILYRDPVIEVALYDPDTSMTNSMDHFNQVGTHGHRNTAANRHLGDVEFTGRVVYVSCLLRRSSSNSSRGS